MQKRRMIRHGDVMLLESEEYRLEGSNIPAWRLQTFKGGKWQKHPTKEVVLALGEVTGHSHILTSEEPILEEGNRSWQVPLEYQRQVVLTAPGTLTHEEHATVEIPPGRWAVVQQREYWGQVVRQVRD